MTLIFKQCEKHWFFTNLESLILTKPITMQVICLEEAAFYTLIEEVVARLKSKSNTQQKKWLSGDEAMSVLNIKSKTTLQNLRDTGKIRFSQPQKRIILYDFQSIQDYLNDNAKETF